MEQPNKIKHLEMIQSVISRMAHNSFIIKGWGVTLVIAMFAFIGNNLEAAYIPLIMAPIILFCGLDTYYLMLEKRFRELYKITAKKNDDGIDFQLAITDSCKNKNSSYWKALKSPSIWAFYLAVLTVAIVVIVLILKNVGGNAQ